MFYNQSEWSGVMYGNDNIYETSLTSCDDVIDDVITKISAVKICDSDS